VRSLERARATQRAAEAVQLEALARKAGMSPDDAARLAQGLRAQIPNDWTFVMLSPSQNSAVVRWLSENSDRPIAALRLWARLFEVIRNDTGEIMQTRDELAQWLGVDPRHISRIMSELASINAVRREKRGREVRYFMNSTIATHLPGHAARQAAREADGPLLVVVQGGQAQNGSD
jgi:CRP-like cAMP-binding protein